MKKITAPKTADVSKKPSTRRPAAKTGLAKAATSGTATARKQATKAPTKRTAVKTTRTAVAPDLYSSLHALLHTMRVIEQHEEPLCSMQDELRRTGNLSAAHRRRLQKLVDELPAADYQADLETLRQAVSA